LVEADDENSAHQHHGLAHDSGKLDESHVTEDDHLDDEHVDRRNRGGLGHGEEAGVDAAEHDDGQR